MRSEDVRALRIVEGVRCSGGGGGGGGGVEVCVAWCSYCSSSAVQYPNVKQILIVEPGVVLF